MHFPKVRHRRLRTTPVLRELVRETSLAVSDLIYPLFVTHGTAVRDEVVSMPGVYHFSLDQLQVEVAEALEHGLRAFILFGVPASKDANASEAYAADGIVQQALRILKHKFPDVLLIADTCVCQYTDHGHCGIVRQAAGNGHSYIDNDTSLDLLARTAVSQAQAGADVIAPSNMMDGFVTKIREALDSAGFEHVPIMSYAVKYASAFYGPFRDAAHSTPQFGDRRAYQMDSANVREALREAESDVSEGADFLMVKPALAYLDVLRALRERFNLPLVAYNVSAEYSMVKAAAANGWLDERAIVLETLLGMKRAGADLIITYHAKDAACWLREAHDKREERQ
jgi:porphobilinogen synthase